MARLGTKLRDSLFGLLRRSEESREDIEGIRRAMLLALGRSADEEATLERHLLFAKDIDALWHARPALMNVLSASDGESNARKSLTQITTMFKDSGPRLTQRGNRRWRH